MKYEYDVFDGEKKMHYVSFGSGKKILMVIAGISLTGLYGLGEAIASAYASFSDDYTVYFFDRRTEVQPGFTVDDMTDDVVDAMDELDIEKAYIFGVSQGGMIAQCIAQRYPERVYALILGSSASRTNSVLKNVSKIWCGCAEKKDKDALASSLNEKLIGIKVRETVGNDLYSFASEPDPALFRRFGILAADLAVFDVSDRLDMIKCPVLVIGDRDDEVLTGEASEEIAEKLGCELYMYEGYGHAVYDFAPDYKQRVKDFLAKTR